MVCSSSTFFRFSSRISRAEEVVVPSRLPASISPIITAVLAGYDEPDQDGKRKPEALYGARKMWAHPPGGHRRGPVHRGTG